MTTAYMLRLLRDLAEYHRQELTEVDYALRIKTEDIERLYGKRAEVERGLAQVEADIKRIEGEMRD
jgi:hypothetical protein